MELFIETSLILVCALGIALVMRLLKQPLIVGYILTGIIVGPYGINMLHSGEVLELFAKIGITILLFIVGLNLNPQVIREVGKVSLVTGLGQVLFTSIVGFAIAMLLGIDRVAALFVAIALTFSSTIIILKLLSDKGDLNKLYGKIAIGFLLVQDIVATIILLVATSFATESSNNVLLSAAQTLGSGVVVIALVMFFSSRVLPFVSRFVADSQELLFLFSIAWGMGLATLFSRIGFSVEIGALVAGVTLSMTPYAYESASRLRPLRDFFIVIFFILLGAEMMLTNIASLFVPALVLSIFVLIGNPIIVIILMNLLGYSRRTGFHAGLTVAQISEFSLILASLGFQMGALSKDVLSLITLVGLVTIAGSTYLILYSEKIYPKVEALLSLLELKKTQRRDALSRSHDAILFGYQRVGDDFLKAFERMGLVPLVVDFNPESIQILERQDVLCRYGDAHDVEFLAELDFSRVRYVVATLPEFETTRQIVQAVRRVNKRAIIVVFSHNRDETLALYAEGASYVVVPHYLGAEYATRLIGRLGIDKSAYRALREKHFMYLEKRVV